MILGFLLVLIGLVYESSQNNGSKATPIHDYMFRKCLHGVVRCRLSILALALLPCVIPTGISGMRGGPA